MTYVLYHGDGCDDGFGAAYAAWKRFGDHALYLPVKYDEPLPLMPSRASVFILDFSYPRDVLWQMFDHYIVSVLDHHKSAAEDLKDLPNCVFDMERSGAGMAWDYFHPGQPRPPLIDYVEDYDLYRFALERTRTISSAIRSYPKEFKVWDSFAHETDRLRDEGTAIERYVTRMVEHLAESVQRETWPEGVACVVNAPTEVTNQLADFLMETSDSFDFVAVYRDGDLRRSWSLRSKGEMDVSAVAKARGGGGHRNSAGFREALP